MDCRKTKDYQTNLRIAVLLICLCGSLFSCHQTDYDDTVFWKITHPESKKSSYILGTVHILDTNFIKFPKHKFYSIIESSDIVCTEVIPEQFEELDKNTPNFFSSKEEDYISNTLDKEYYHKLMRISENSKYALYHWLPYLDSVTPARVTQLLMYDRPMMRSDLFEQFNYSPEEDVLAFAKQNSIEISPLESTKDWNSYDSYFMGESNNKVKNLENLKYAIDIYDDKDYVDIYQWYSEQNLSLGDTDIYSDSLMIIRNERMSLKIDSIVKMKSAFITVGVAHLPYEFGILNLLSDKGYLIEKIEINFNSEIP